MPRRSLQVDWMSRCDAAEEFVVLLIFRSTMEHGVPNTDVAGLMYLSDVCLKSLQIYSKFKKNKKAHVHKYSQPHKGTHLSVYIKVPQLTMHV